MVFKQAVLLSFAASLLATPAAAQVEVAPLAALDLFSAGSRDTDFDTGVWKGSSAAVARQVIPTLTTKDLTPAAASLARRLLATAAAAPDGAGADAELAAARTLALIALGDARTAAAIAERLPNLQTSAELSQAAAEAALLVGADERACAIADQLATGRGELYWLRLRAYCQATGGRTDAAELTHTLVNQVKRDGDYSRLLAALITPGTDPGAASLKSGVELAMTRRLGLEIGAEARKTAAPAIFAYLEGEAQNREAAVEPTALAARLTSPMLADLELAGLFAQAAEADAKVRPRYRQAILIAAALGAPLNGDQRAELAAMDVSAGPTSQARLAALDAAAEAGLAGETVLHVLAMSGSKPAHPADAARIVSALRQVGLAEEARRFAHEALVALDLR